MQNNWKLSLDFVWQKGYDSPDDGYHSSPGDPGGATFGGVIAVTWEDAVKHGVVHGALSMASRDALAAVLRWKCWGAACDGLPPGLDLALFNGRMMSGGFPRMFQSLLGFAGEAEVDGDIASETIAIAQARDPMTLIHAIYGRHYEYLTGLPTWGRFGDGWAKRLLGAREAALTLATQKPLV